MNVWKFLMFAVMVYVWTCKEVTSAYVTTVLKHLKTRLCAWVWKENTSVVLKEGIIEGTEFRLLLFF